MTKTLKRVIAGVLALVLVVGVIAGVMLIIKHRSKKDVNVYSLQNFSMTNYWGDMSETYGSVSADNVQSVFVSPTQQVTEIFVSEGDSVKVGDKLMAYDTTLSDIELERADISLQRLKLDYDDAVSELAEINTLRPYVPPPPTEPEEKDAKDYKSEKTPMYITGIGTAEDPLVFLWGDSDIFTSTLIKGFLAEAKEQQKAAAEKAAAEKEAADKNAGKKTDTADPSGAPQIMPAPDDQEEDTAVDDQQTDPNTDAETDPVTEPDTDTETDPGTDPDTDPGTEPDADTETDPGTEPDTDTDPGTEPDTDTDTDPDTDPGTDPETDPGTEPDIDPDSVFVTFVKREFDSLKGDVTDFWGMQFVYSGNDYAFVMCDAVLPPEEEPEEESEPEYVDPGPMYTAAEIAQMKSDKQEEIKNLDLEIRIAEVELERMRQEVNDGVVLANIDGVVKTLGDPDESMMNNIPVITVSGGGGYYVTGTVSELDLDNITIGQPVTVTSWENYATYDGTIVEISTYPTDNYGYYGDGNTNVSYYPFTVFIDDSAALREYEYVEMQYNSSAVPDGSFYIEKFFIRSENGKSYVYARGEDDTLERREVSTGKNLWGSYVQIRGGISVDDYLAFPYGSDVKDGARTVEAEPDALYNNGGVF